MPFNVFTAEYINDFWLLGVFESLKHPWISLEFLICPFAFITHEISLISHSREARQRQRIRMEELELQMSVSAAQVDVCKRAYLCVIEFPGW